MWPVSPHVYNRILAANEGMWPPPPHLLQAMPMPPPHQHPGVTYIKFSKTSEAALAMEEMNGRVIGANPRPLKVLIAHSREQGSRREANESERLLRLFVMVPKSMTEAELKEHFSEFGDIDYVSIVRDRATKESKGYGYVKYNKISHAAKAFEGCERSFKPVFADPKPTRNGGDSYDRSYSNSNHSGVLPPDLPLPPLSLGGAGGLNPDGSTSSGAVALSVIVSPQLNQDQIWRLFDLVPGLDYCHLKQDPRAKMRGGLASVVYNNPQSAAYAKEKLHGFEYPPGNRLIIKYDNNIQHQQDPSLRALPYSSPRIGSMGPSNGNPRLQTDLATLAETIAHATSLIQAAGLGQRKLENYGMAPGQYGMSPAGGPPAGPVGSDTYDPAYCSVRLPSPQPLAPTNCEVADRLFIVCHPTPPPIFALKDVFGRFGNLIDVYLLNGKNCGYAKYATKESAEKAIEVLHGQEVCGSRLKVMPAEPYDKSDAGRKRLRIDDQH